MLQLLTMLLWSQLNLFMRCLVVLQTRIYWLLMLLLKSLVFLSMSWLLAMELLMYLLQRDFSQLNRLLPAFVTQLRFLQEQTQLLRQWGENLFVFFEIVWEFILMGLQQEAMQRRWCWKLKAEAEEDRRCWEHLGSTVGGFRYLEAKTYFWTRLVCTAWGTKLYF